jgi:hypothetical protein
MRLVILLLLVCNSVYALEYGFDENCPFKYRRAVRAAMQGRGYTERKKPTRPWEQDILRFSWVYGGNIATTIVNGVAVAPDLPEIDREGFCVCWLYYNTICFNSASKPTLNELDADLKIMIDLATKKDK